MQFTFDAKNSVFKKRDEERSEKFKTEEIRSESLNM